MQVFTKLKRKAREEDESAYTSVSDQVRPIKEIEPNVEELRDLAMSSYRLQLEVIKTKKGSEVGF